MKITIDELLRETVPARSERESKALQELIETTQLSEAGPMSADDHESKARKLQSRADGLKVGEKKRAFQTAADAHSKAATAIRVANDFSNIADECD